MVDKKTAEDFSSYMKKFPDMYAALAQRAKNHSIEEHLRILDLGAGPGLLAIELQRLMPQAEIIGIDPLINMVHLAQKNLIEANASNVHIIQGVSENIPLKENTVDVIVSRFSLPYWTTPKQSFSEMNRVLKPSGTIILEALNRDFPAWRLAVIKVHMLFNKAGRYVTKYHVDAYRQAYRFEQVERFLTDTGLKVIEKQGTKKEWRFIVVAQKKG